jgi:hypothetical protein
MNFKLSTKTNVVEDTLSRKEKDLEGLLCDISIS